MGDLQLCHGRRDAPIVQSILSESSNLSRQKIFAPDLVDIGKQGPKESFQLSRPMKGQSVNLK